MVLQHKTKSVFVSYNCKSIKRSISCVRDLCENADIVALQETWLLPHDIPMLGTIHPEFAYTGTSAVDTSAGILRGRPYGGVAVLWRKSVYSDVSVVQCKNPRISAIVAKISDREILVCSIYMPTDSVDNLMDFTDCFAEVCAIIENSTCEALYILGDFNAHPGELFGKELMALSAEQQWTCADISYLGSDSGSFTFISDAHGSTRWLDHCIVSSSALQSISNVSIKYDTYWSDHLPLIIECDLNIITCKLKYYPEESLCKSVMWGNRNNKEIDTYKKHCFEQFNLMNLPTELTQCDSNVCSNKMHIQQLDVLYNHVVKVLTEAAIISRESNVIKGRKKGRVVGWNMHVRDAHREARLHFTNWVWHNKPKCGIYYENMCNSRRIFKSKLKWCINKEEQIKMDIIAQHREANNFKDFWKSTNKLNTRPGLPVSVEGVSDSTQIADLFRNHFRVNSALGPSDSMVGGEAVVAGDPFRVTETQVANTIKRMSRGKSPGHDGLSIEHLKYAGPHLPIILSMFYNLCFSHSHLPQDLMKTIVVPIIKNKTGDLSDKSNYRPISLATVMAKILDSVLDSELDKHLQIHDAQFGFRKNLSTESAILSLKHTVQYYTQRRTPVYACFLDLSKAFDLVSYDVLWRKLASTGVHPQVQRLFKYWYANQTNSVRWAGSHSEGYRLECGVRQGGISSPKLFNLFINQLIVDLSNTRIGCSVDGVCINSVSYADDMALLSPSIGALRKLLGICEAYANRHGLVYNSKKSEYLVFKAIGRVIATVPGVELNGVFLNRVKTVKYLGHYLTEDLDDQVDIERERRALAIRGNMLARRFARCSRQVKVTLFKAYCQSFYTSSLWVSYTKRSLNALRVQYNNAFRMLMGLPRFCSASTMFAESRVDGFHAGIRKNTASLLRRVRCSTNSILKVIADKYDSPVIRSLICTSIGVSV